MIDAYKIGVSIAMTNGVSQVLSVIQRDVMGLNHAVDLTTGGFNRMKVAAAGFGAVVAGGAVLGGVWKVVEASKALNDQLTRTQQLGGAFANTIGLAQATAFKTSFQVPTFNPAELVAMQREIGAQLQNPTEAMEILPEAAKVSMVTSHYTGENQDKIIQNLTKIADLRNDIYSRGPNGQEIMDPVKLANELDMASKALILGGGFLKSSDLLTLTRQAGVPAKSMDADAFYSTMVEMAVSQGAARAGTAATSLFNQMVGGVMPIHTAQEMQKMGILGAGEWYSDHGHVVMNDAASHRLQNDMRDPVGNQSAGCSSSAWCCRGWPCFGSSAARSSGTAGDGAGAARRCSGLVQNRANYSKLQKTTANYSSHKYKIMQINTR